MLIEALTPLKVRVNGRELLLDPGRPQDLSDDEARRLLAKVPDQVRVVSEPVVIEPARRLDDTAVQPIYWEDCTGRIIGPAVPEFVAEAAGGIWIVTTAGWVSAKQLRSRQAFEGQPLMHVIEPIRE